MSEPQPPLSPKATAAMNRIFRAGLTEMNEAARRVGAAHQLAQTAYQYGTDYGIRVGPWGWGNV